MIKRAAFNQGKFPTIAFVNLATAPLKTKLEDLVSALDKQLQRDFVPVWGFPAKLYVAKKPKEDDWQIVFLDDADAADALGYHNLTKDGQPVSKVFVKTIIAAGQKVSVTASHELLEMLIDPGAQLWAQDVDGLFHAYEVCDAVEEEEYEIDGISVSDFLYPSFFESWHQPRSVQFDHLWKVSRPFQTLQNGYQVVSDGSSVRETFGSRPKERNFREVEIRRMHRSEYRKQMMSRGQAVQYGLADTAMRSNVGGSVARAIALHHARELLKALDPNVVDPLPGPPFELEARRRPGRVVDPLPGGDPFDL
jgi:hypothetical protein